MTKLFLILTLIFSLSAFARKTDGQVQTVVEKSEIVLTVKKGFHFNDKAPASVVFDDTEAKLKPTVKTEQKFVFKILEKATKAKLEYYVCDDAKTVCEPHKEEIVLAKRTSAAEGKKDSEPLVVEGKHNFPNGKTTLLKFSAPWCPACIRLQTETMNKSEIKALLAKIDSQEINIDLVENEKISEQYGVKAIPTVILVNEQGEEIKRWLDYQPVKTFADELKAALKETHSVAELVPKAEAGDVVAATKLGYNAYNKMNWKDAIKWLSFSKAEKDLNYKLSAEISLAQDDLGDNEESKKTYAQALEKGFTLTSSVIDQVRWKLDHMEQLKEQKKNIDADAIKALENQLTELKSQKNIGALFAKSTLGDNMNFEKAEVLSMIKRLGLLSGNNEQAKKAQAEMLAATEAVKLSAKTPGQMINAIWYYTQAEATQKAEELLKQLIKAYDKTYVYYQRYANFLSKHKRFEEALVQVDSALKYKEGNDPQLNLIKVKILKELGKKNEALALIDSTLKITQAYPNKYKRTQAALLDLKKNL